MLFMCEAQVEQLNQVFRALADPTRREMVRRLETQDLTVTELVDPYQMSLAGASKHIKVLKNAKLIHRTIRAARIFADSTPYFWLPFTRKLEHPMSNYDWFL